MILPLSSRSNRRGSTCMIVLWMTLLTGLVLAAYLTMVGSQNFYTMRSQAWNRSIAVAEAGIEEALAHLNKNGTTNYNLWVDGWLNWGGSYYKSAYLDDAIYEVTITKAANPTIVARGYTPTVQNYAWQGGAGPYIADFFWLAPRVEGYSARGIQVETIAQGLFIKGLVAKDTIDLNGNNIRTDSFDSADPLYSNNGLYDPTRTRDNGDVATASGLTNSVNIEVGNANIYGHASTGPGGSATCGPNGAIGSAAWNNGGNKGIQSGWFRDDMNISFPPVSDPFSGGYFTPGSGSVGGTNYSLVLGSGKYLSSSNVKLTGQDSILVNGNATWWCQGGLDLGGKGQIIIAAGARLILFIGQNSGSAVSGSLSGNGVLNGTGNATNTLVYGMAKCTSISLSGNAAFIGAIYAPDANMSMNGGGNNTMDFCGAGVFKTVTMNGHFNFHYDENLGRFGPRCGYVIISWNEI
jgi:hypothetical protein